MPGPRTPEKILKLYKLALPMKEMPRAGVLLPGAARTNSDSLAAHSWSVALLSYITARLLEEECEAELDMGHILSMAVLHDLPEVAMGDIPSGLKRSNPKVKAAAEELESAAIDFLSGRSHLDDIVRGPMCAYSGQKSDEGKVVKFADVLDAIFHRKVRIGADPHGPFIKSAKESLKGGCVGNALNKWLEAVCSKVQTGWDEQNPWHIAN
jgi:5'-deoxynucleotidase YfbR-like HD superfamily hydrolase